MKKTASALTVTAVAAVAFTVGTFVHTQQRSAAAPIDPSSTAAQMDRAEAAVARRPDDQHAHAFAAVTALQMAAEHADSRWYVRAEQAAQRALEISPHNVPALEATARLSVARHRFRDAIAPATRAARRAPDRFVALEILTDASIELGQYERGFAFAERRLALRPDMASYSRASYAAELRGERDLALELMRQAADSARPGSGERAWARSHVATLHLGSGQLNAARREIRGALHEAPDDSTAIAADARIAAASGELDRAAERLRESLAAAPVAAVASDLALLEQARGNATAAATALARAEEIDDRESKNGVLLDLDAAAVRADFHTPTDTDVAAARRGHRDRPGVVGDDALGWVLTRAGRCDEGLRYARRSLRLGTQDALMFFHAGMAAHCTGDRAVAQRYLQSAVDLNPRFSVRWSPVAHRILRQLTSG